MASKIYQLPLDTKMDQDIINRMEDIPRSRKAEWVRTALRVYMSLEKGSSVNTSIITTAPIIQDEPPKVEKKKAKDISGLD